MGFPTPWPRFFRHPSDSNADSSGAKSPEVECMWAMDQSEMQVRIQWKVSPGNLFTAICIKIFYCYVLFIKSTARIVAPTVVFLRPSCQNLARWFEINRLKCENTHTHAHPTQNTHHKYRGVNQIFESMLTLLVKKTDLATLVFCWLNVAQIGLPWTTPENSRMAKQQPVNIDLTTLHPSGKTELCI